MSELSEVIGLSEVIEWLRSKKMRVSIVRFSLLLPLLGQALGRVVELPELDTDGLPIKPTDVAAKVAPEMESLGVNFFERISKGYWYVYILAIE